MSVMLVGVKLFPTIISIKLHYCVLYYAIFLLKCVWAINIAYGIEKLQLKQIQVHTYTQY